MHEYVRIEQIHSICNCPPNWAYPVFCLLFKLVPNLGNLLEELVIRPDMNAVTQLESQTTEIVNGREYQTNLPSTKIEEQQTDNAAATTSVLSDDAYTSSASYKVMQDLSIKLGVPMADLIA